MNEIISYLIDNMECCYYIIIITSTTTSVTTTTIIIIIIIIIIIHHYNISDPELNEVAGRELYVLLTYL